MRDIVKNVLRVLATLAAAPWLLMFAVKSVLLGRDRALEGSSQSLSMIPGVTGDYLRGAFLAIALEKCDRTATVQFGTLFSQTGASLGANVYVGPRCHLGLVHIERDVLLAAGVHVPSGSATHGTEDLDRPIREQPGVRTPVRIGEGTWVGSAAVVLADVGKHCVIGAGSVVTKPIPDYSVAAGVPARVLRSRLPGGTGSSPA